MPRSMPVPDSCARRSRCTGWMIWCSPAAGVPSTCWKIDVEGAEHLVLSGARETLIRDRPLLLIEIHSVVCMLQVLALLHPLGLHRRAPARGPRQPVLHRCAGGELTTYRGWRNRNWKQRFNCSLGGSHWTNLRMTAPEDDFRSGLGRERVVHLFR
ncbi:MAG: FkbM family methyltransferase [Flavobacteriales bacterium]|nr:FkbM family methyltransferase [Flavobacteriales bacterium]